MKQGDEKKLLRIFIHENCVYSNKPLYEAIIDKAKELRLAGATVLRGIMGYTAGHIKTEDRPAHMSEELHVVIEMVDKEENIEKIIPFLEKTVTEGLVTIETVRVIW